MENLHGVNSSLGFIEAVHASVVMKDATPLTTPTT